MSTEGFYPGGHKLDEAYFPRWQPMLAERVASAARRLAALLNKSLGNR